MNNSQALENRTGDSPDIIYMEIIIVITLTSSSNFIIRFILAKGKAWSLKFSAIGFKFVISSFIWLNLASNFSVSSWSRFYVK